MSCTECGEESKYKCPICRQPYCSVSCCKKHKEKVCSAPPNPPKEEIPDASVTYDFPSEDTVPLAKLKLLEQSSDIRKCLENPYVREILEILDKSPHPDELMQEYMTEPIFTELVEACLKVVQPQGDLNQ